MRGKKKGNRREDRERNEERARESETGERPAEPTLQRERTASLANHFAVLIPRCDSFRNRVAGEKQDGETLESSSESSEPSNWLRDPRSRGAIPQNFLRVPRKGGIGDTIAGSDRRDGHSASDLDVPADS